MSYTIDVNILIYASNTDASEHARAQTLVSRMVSGPELSVVLWPVLMGFLRISTHPRIMPIPLTVAEASTVIDQFVAARSVRVVGEDARMWTVYQHLEIGQPIRGNLVPDAVIAALMLGNGVSTIFTRDRGFRRFDGIKVVDPFA